MNFPTIQPNSILSISAAQIAPHHIAHLLDEGFQPEQIQNFAAQGVRSISETEARALNFLARDENGNLVSGSGLLFPFTNTFFQLRLDVPIIRKNGSEAKYLTPCRKQAQALTSVGCKVHTEGWKDAMAGSLHGGIETGALAGVSHYRRALKPNSGGTIIFDADGWHNPSVFRCLVNAGKWIGGKINLLPKIPGQPKAGLCEYFKAGYTQKDYQALIDNAYTPEAFLLELPNHWKELPSDRLSEAVRVLLKLAVKLLDPMQRSVLIKKIARVTGIDRRMVGGEMAKTMAKEQEQKRGTTPAEIAAELAEDYRDRLAWNDEAGLWYRYEAEFPGVWALESDTSIGAVVVAEFESRMGLDYKADWIEQCIKILKWKLIVKRWDQPRDLLPFRNGVLNTNTGEFLDHAPGYRFTWSLPREHDPHAIAWSTIENWMDVATGGSRRLKNILLCFLNACLKGRSDLQRALYLTGPGGTGKGTYLRLVLSLIGRQNNYSSSLAEWCGNRFETANAYGKRLLSFADEDKYAGGLGNFKKVTGGDAIRGEIKRKQAFDFVFDGMVLLASNYPIFSGDTSSGIHRRLLLAAFDVIIPPNQRRDVDKEFEPELSALTNYVLSISDEFVSETLRQSSDQAPEVIERSWDWRMRQDSVAAWLNECVIRDPQACERVGNDREDADSLFGSYYRYCDRTGSRAKGSREFSPALLELVNHDPALNWSVEKKRVSNGMVVYGLRLRRAEDANQPYCLEVLANVGSSSDVGSNVESDVELKALSSASHVGCVGSTDLTEKLEDQPEVVKEDCSTENSDYQESPPCTPYTNQLGQAISTLHHSPTAPGEPSYTLLEQKVLMKVIASMSAIDSVRSFEEFREKYERLSDSQQRQVWNAANPEARKNYQQWLDAFLAVPQAVWDARKALIRVVTLPEMNQIRQQIERNHLTLAYKLIHPDNQKLLKRLLEESKRVQP